MQDNRLSGINLDALHNMALADVVRSFGVRLEPVGNKLRGLCPLHNDRSSPSFYVFEDEHYFCFGCRAYGHVQDFIAAMTGTTKHRVAQAWIKKDTMENAPLKLKLKEAPKQNYKNALALFASKWYNGLPDGKKDISLLKSLDDVLYNFDYVGYDEYQVFVDALNQMRGE